MVLINKNAPPPKKKKTTTKYSRVTLCKLSTAAEWAGCLDKLFCTLTKLRAGDLNVMMHLGQSITEGGVFNPLGQRKRTSRKRRKGRRWGRRSCNPPKKHQCGQITLQL